MQGDERDPSDDDWDVLVSQNVGQHPFHVSVHVLDEALDPCRIVVEAFTAIDEVRAMAREEIDDNQSIMGSSSDDLKYSNHNAFVTDSNDGVVQSSEDDIVSGQAPSASMQPYSMEEHLQSMEPGSNSQLLTYLWCFKYTRLVPH